MNEKQQLENFLEWFRNCEFEWTTDGRVLLSNSNSIRFLDYKYEVEKISFPVENR